MTDKEIMKALDICNSNSTCHICPYRKQMAADCVVLMMGDAADLIKRQQKEIERLQNSCKDCAGCTQWLCDCANTKDEAIREFMDKIVEKLSDHYRIVHSDEDLEWNRAISKAIEIVKRGVQNDRQNET